ncbi:hypothetical protein BDM02DRAFT_3192480 [Thelephora ganbajun]|uniref:Uncharacterized protein n=1 Tax=Thelephora ganbajun TaxID=370292 RepID=A0ACB6YZR9_THEGA|nr:hypothetical protein BDM02DRAFT_3192480 [Thelephora ganbajun]
MTCAHLGLVSQEDQESGTAPKSPIQMRKSLTLRILALKNKAPQKTRKATNVMGNNGEAMPPPRVTHTITTQLSRQSNQEEEPDPLADEEPTTPHTKSISARKKLLVGLLSSADSFESFTTSVVQGLLQLLSQNKIRKLDLKDFVSGKVVNT